MVFSSLVFIWLFLPVVLVGYFLMPAQLKNVFLLIFSLLFYAWGEPECILLMIFLILVNYIIGIIMERNGNKRKTLLILSIVINIAILGYFKYFNFFIQVFFSCLINIPIEWNFMNKNDSIILSFHSFIISDRLNNHFQKQSLVSIQFNLFHS